MTAPQSRALLRLADVAALADDLGMKRKPQRAGQPGQHGGAWNLGDARLVAYEGRHDGLSVRVSRRSGPVQTVRWEARFGSGTPNALVRAALAAAMSLETS